MTKVASLQTNGRSQQPLQLGNFTYPKYAFRRPAELDDGTVRRYPLVIVGGGMVGLTLAIDLARKGVHCVLLDDNDTVSAGSRSIAQARRTMEIWSRLGCAEPMRRKGVSWSRGHTHYEADTVLSFTVFPEGGTRFPSFTSLAQYYVEYFLVERSQELPDLDIRWLNRVSDVKTLADGVELLVETPEGAYRIEADWLVAADGAKSIVRSSLGLDFPGDRLQDKFVIADVRCDAELPFERNFWFDPPFYEGNTVLRVPQSDSIWRIDWQIDPKADVEKELAPDVVQERLRRILNGRSDFKVEWVSTYASEHRLMDRFRHGRVFFMGDAAHQFSPFGGGRGGNSGIQDADNLAWKLAAVVQGRASQQLLDSYTPERHAIAAGNLSDSSKSTEFITPKSSYSQALHDAVLGLAKLTPFAPRYINTGRFAVWPVLDVSPLSVPDRDDFPAEARPGTPVFDCRVTTAAGAEAWLTDQVGDVFALVVYGTEAAPSEEAMDSLSQLFPTRLVRLAPAGETIAEGGLGDSDGAFARQYAARPGTAYLFRPDQHVLARWRQVDVASVVAAMRHCLGLAREERS